MFCCTSSVGEIAFSEIELTTNQQFNGLVVKEELKTKILPKYIFWCSKNLMNELIRNSGRTTFDFLSVKKLKEIKIPIPSIEVQQEFVNKIEEHQKEIEENMKLIELNNFKIQDEINGVWGE